MKEGINYTQSQPEICDASIRCKCGDAFTVPGCVLSVTGQGILKAKSIQIESQNLLTFKYSRPSIFCDASTCSSLPSSSSFHFSLTSPSHSTLN